MQSGVDSSSSVTATALSCLQAGGYTFVGRYYSRTTHIEGKKLTAAEAQLLAEGGMEIVSVYEDAPTESSYFSADRGAEDAATALEQADLAGQPEGTAIYFSIDYDASSADIEGCITAYFEAIDKALAGTYAVGVYGSGATCTAIMNAGLAKYAWLAQSSGWSGYHTFDGWAIKQGAEQSVCGLDSDLDEAQADFGAWVPASTSAAP